MSKSVFEVARSTFVSQLSDADKSLLQNCGDPDTFLELLKAEDAEHHNASLSRKAIDFCQPVILGFDRFSRALDTLSNAKPNILALLWGGLRIVLHVAQSFQEFFETIMSSLEMVGQCLSRVESYETLFLQSSSVQSNLERLYCEILRFFLSTKKLYREATEGKKSKFLPRRLHIVFKAMLSSFEESASANQAAIQRILENLDKEAHVANFKDISGIKTEQKLEADAARQHRNAVNVEHDAAKRSRDLVTAEFVSQSLERRAQTDWRQIETKYWNEQQKLTQSLSDSIAEESRRSLLSWLAPTSSEDTYYAALKLRYPDTCEWILGTRQFTDWTLKVHRILWLHGMPGAGKTILSASTIKHLQDSVCPDEAVLCFYFDHGDRDRISVRSFLASILVSLLGKNAAYLQAVSPRLNDARLAGRSPNIRLLQECISDAPRYFENIFLVVDALDESSDSDALMQCLGSNCFQKMSMLVTSRTNAHIQESLLDLLPGRLEIELSPALTNSDIINYVEGEVNEMVQRQKIKLRDSALQQEIISVISAKADGMFLWVKCQLDQVRKLKTDRAIRQSLRRLPKDMNETYAQALQRLVQHHDEDDVVQIQRLFRWLVHAIRPLDLEEMAEVIAVDFGQETFDISAVVTDPLVLLKYGEGLISISGDKRRFLHLSHFSVKEFLLSDYCWEAIPQFYMDIGRSHAEIAQVCLTALSFEECAVRTKSRVTVPGNCAHLYNYAITHWVDHYRIAHESESCPESLASSLLVSQPLSSNFIFMRTVLGRGDDYLPIHYCAQYGLVFFLQEILNSGVDIDVASSPYGSPLNFAARYDQPLVNQFLLDRGANVNGFGTHPNHDTGSNCLHWAMDEDRISFVSIALIKYISETPGLNINSLGGLKTLQRPLHYAARANRPDILEILLTCEAKIDKLDGEGRTPLQVAIEEKALDSVSYLLDQGASIVRADKCDSMREGGFGLSTTVLPTSMSESRWEASALIRSHRPVGAPPPHWGFKLGEAAQYGHLEAVKKLWDAALTSQVSNSREENGESCVGLEMSDAEIENKVGTSFGALDLALHNRHIPVVVMLLQNMILLLEHQQRKDSTSSALDIHAIMIYDRPNTPFCDCLWSESILYVSIVLGHLRLALATLESQERLISTFRIPEAIAVCSIPREIQLIIYIGWKGLNRLSAHAGDQRDGTGNRDESEDIGPDFERTRVIEVEVSRLCEKARNLWKSKRNRKEAFRRFLTGDANEASQETGVKETSAASHCNKAGMFDYLHNLGFDLNSLDRAGRTPLYWAHVRSWTVEKSKLESLGAELFVPPHLSLEQIRESVLALLGDLDSPHDAATFSLTANSATSLDLSRKWDWDNIGRYLYFGGDADNAVRAFEAGTVFDPTVSGDTPAVHYFNCDSCFTEYSYENLLRGMRYVPQGLANIDLCEKCAAVLGSAKVGVPSAEWIKGRQAAHDEERRKFEQIDQGFTEASVRDKLKTDWKREAALSLKRGIQAWVRRLKESWQATNQNLLLERYTRIEEDYKRWLATAGSREALAKLEDLERW